jgi:hypothetical protein
MEANLSCRGCDILQFVLTNKAGDRPGAARRAYWSAADNASMPGRLTA